MIKALDKDIKEEYNLNEIDDICEIEFNGDEDWLEKRKNTIGGSEVGIVLGLNEYSSKLQLYKSKKGEAKDSPDNVYTRKGTELEKLIFDNYVVPYFADKDYKVSKPNKIFTRTGTPWLSANLDGLAMPNLPFNTSSDNIVVEIKWVSQWGAQKWNASEEYENVPPSYYAQVQSYMYHTGAQAAVIFALFDDTWTCHTYVIRRNESFIRRLIGETQKFYSIHLVADIPPSADIRFDSADIAKRIGSTDLKKMPVKHSEEYDLLLCKYKALKSSEKELDAEVKETLNKILEMHLEGYAPDKVDIRFTCTKRTTSSIDTKKLKECFPEAAAECTKISEYTWTSVK